MECFEQSFVYRLYSLLGSSGKGYSCFWKKLVKICTARVFRLYGIVECNPPSKTLTKLKRNYMMQPKKKSGFQNELGGKHIQDSMPPDLYPLFLLIPL